MSVHRAFPTSRVRLLAFAAAIALVVSAWAAAQAYAFVYWGNSSGTTIGRANLDGSGVNQSFIPLANGPYGLLVDGQHVYWTNYFGGTIGRANLDGTGGNQSLITGANGPLAVAVDGGHVYWANYSTIGRANLDGTGVDQNFITGATNVRGWRSTASTSTGATSPLAGSGARTSTAPA